MGHKVNLINRQLNVMDSEELFYKRKLISLMDNPDYDLSRHEQTLSGMIKLLIENGECTLDQIRKS